MGHSVYVIRCNCWRDAQIWKSQKNCCKNGWNVDQKITLIAPTFGGGGGGGGGGGVAPLIYILGGGANIFDDMIIHTHFKNVPV